MKIELTDNKLKVNKWECRSVTIVKENGIYTAQLFHIKGISKKIPVICPYSKRQDYDHITKEPLFKIIKLRKEIKSKNFNYEGINLQDVMLFGEFKVHHHAQNKNGEYINYYEK